MAQKSAKVTTKASATAKKTVKKTSAAKKTVKKADVKKMDAMPVVAPCECGHECKCGHDCQCASHAHKCCGGCKFGRFIKKLFFVLIVFALGFATAKIYSGYDCPNARAPRPVFVNGCLDVNSVKCPRLLSALPEIDVNGDNCITRDEYRAARRQARAERSGLVANDIVEAETTEQNN